MITLGPKGFRAHLERQARGAIVGYANKECHCPLAQYAKAQGADHVDVSIILITVYPARRAPAHHHEPNAWQKRFIRQVDKVRIVGAPVTRETALKALDVAEGIS